MYRKFWIVTVELHAFLGVECAGAAMQASPSASHAPWEHTHLQVII